MEQSKKTFCVYEEYQRLNKLLDNVDESKKTLTDELLKKASFLKVELNRLELSIKKVGTMQTSNKGNIRINPSYKIYLQTIGVYQSLIRTINTIIGKSVIDEDDEFEEFISSIEKR